MSEVCERRHYLTGILLQVLREDARLVRELGEANANGDGEPMGSRVMRTRFRIQKTVLWPSEEVTARN